MVARRADTGVVTSVGEAPTIRCDQSGATLRFTYRCVKRAADEPRHIFVIGDRVYFRRKNKQNVTGPDGVLWSVERAYQVRLIQTATGSTASQSGRSSSLGLERMSSTSESAPNDNSSPSSEADQSGSASVTSGRDALPVAIPVAGLVGGHVWRHDPYSTACNHVAYGFPCV
eukprot:TRINITY_DN10727_c0_g1_i1.p1 TRINITY_DN10727_c0_g1~~TRINITY_DN10727_c0_g1_i1.p1  ORF type:complete len:172 (+),score=19.34 TRINITY_DN10727_c0_g1_i1:138-653(+)